MPLPKTTDETKLVNSQLGLNEPVLINSTIQVIKKRIAVRLVTSLIALNAPVPS